MLLHFVCANQGQLVGSACGVVDVRRMYAAFAEAIGFTQDVAVREGWHRSTAKPLVCMAFCRQSATFIYDVRCETQPALDTLAKFGCDNTWGELDSISRSGIDTSHIPGSSHVKMEGTALCSPIFPGVAYIAPRSSILHAMLSYQPPTSFRSRHRQNCEDNRPLLCSEEYNQPMLCSTTACYLFAAIAKDRGFEGTIPAQFSLDPAQGGNTYPLIFETDPNAGTVRLLERKSHTNVLENAAETLTGMHSAGNNPGVRGDVLLPSAQELMEQASNDEVLLWQRLIHKTLQLPTTAPNPKSTCEHGVYEKIGTCTPLPPHSLYAPEVRARAVKQVELAKKILQMSMAAQTAEGVVLSYN
jgi:hypothetical protein